MQLFFDIILPLIIVFGLACYGLQKRKDRLLLSSYEAFAEHANYRFIEMLVRDKETDDVLVQLKGADIKPKQGWVVQGTWGYEGSYLIDITIQYDASYVGSREDIDLMMRDIILPRMIKHAHANSKVLSRCDYEGITLLGWTDTVKTYQFQKTYNMVLL